MTAMNAQNTDTGPQPFFETIAVGDAVPGRAYGSVDIIDSVRWAGFQENYAQLHYDREYVRGEPGLKTFIASGAYRESLMVRLLTDWMGPKARLSKLETRQAYPTFEGDSLRYAGTVVAKSEDPADPWVDLEMEGFNQDDRPILKSNCRVVLQSKSSGEV